MSSWPIMDNELPQAIALISSERLPTLKATAADECDTMSALIKLGFKPDEASSAVAPAVNELNDGATLDAIVRLALKKAFKP